MNHVPLAGSSTQPFQASSSPSEELVACYHALLSTERLSWLTQCRKLRQLGAGGQGVVYLSERLGTDSFTVPFALKIFSPEKYRDVEDYQEDMRRTAEVAGRVALIQHDNVLDVYHFIEREGIRLMAMEWVDGYDLSQLLTEHVLELTRRRVRDEHWEYVTKVILTADPRYPRLKPGVAIQVLRECLAGLGALHREGIVHGDLKPSNIMLKRTGNVKVIDIGSAIDLRGGSVRRVWSPVYAAPEVLAGAENSPRSDLASLGYILIEMLAGRSPFAGLTTYRELVEAKRHLVERLPELLPEEVTRNDLLLHLCRHLVAPDPACRFASAEAADLERKGAVDFHHQLVKSDLASVYENDLRYWLNQLG